MEMGLLTPAQRYAADHPDTCPEDIRSAVDGMPCDLFVAKSADDDLVYYGQYNMNNEKSDSYPIFGQDKAIGGEIWGEGDTLDYLEAGESGEKEYLPVCIETLNNSNDLACSTGFRPRIRAMRTLWTPTLMAVSSSTTLKTPSGRMAAVTRRRNPT